MYYRKIGAFVCVCVFCIYIGVSVVLCVCWFIEVLFSRCTIRLSLLLCVFSPGFVFSIKIIPSLGFWVRYFVGVCNYYLTRLLFTVCTHFFLVETIQKIYSLIVCPRICNFFSI